MTTSIGTDWGLVALVGLACIVASAFFSGTETGLMSVNRVRLRRSAAGETPVGRRLRRLLHDLEEPVITCLVGSNLVNVVFSALMTVVLTERFGDSGQGLAVAVVSVLVLIGGDILPKVIYREYPERMMLASMPVFTVVMAVLWPIRLVLRGYRKLWQHLLPSPGGQRRRLDRKSLAALMLAHTPLSNQERGFGEILDRFLQLAHRPLTALMRPLEAVVAVGPESTVAECLAVAARSGLSRLPVTREDGCALQAYVTARELLFLPPESAALTVPRRLFRPFVLVDARMTPYEVFEELRGQANQMAAVCDPAGNPLGLITLEDLIETVMGSIHDEFDPQAGAGATA
jgi:putative hemolysin